MLPNISRDREAYDSLYQGKSIRLVAMDKNLETAIAVQLAETIRSLVDSGIDISLQTAQVETTRQLKSLLAGTDVFDTYLRKDPNEMVADAARNGNHPLEEMIILQKAGGILNESGRVIPLVSDNTLSEKLEAEKKRMTMDPSDRALQTYILRGLAETPKIVLTKPEDLDREIHTWMGAGTMFFDSTKIQTGPILPEEHGIFHTMNATNEERQIFRHREENELAVALAHHSMVRVGVSPIGGMSLIPHENNWKELSLVWGAVPKTGVGKHILDGACTQAGDSPVYALTVHKGAIKTFDSHPAFANLGRVSAARDEGRLVHLPEEVQSYNVPGRDPYVFVRQVSTPDIPSAYPSPAL